MTTRTILALATTATLVACSSVPYVSAPEGVKADFGNSVQSMIQAQTANPATLTEPSAAPVTGVDPDYANEVVKQMRKDVSKSEATRQPIQISIGSSGGG